jgi:hypothetical protein
MSLKCIILTPYFNGDNFAGYHQVGGDSYYDSYGHLYGFVSLEDYNKMRDELENKIEELEITLTNKKK